MVSNPNWILTLTLTAHFLSVNAACTITLFRLKERTKLEHELDCLKSDQGSSKPGGIIQLDKLDPRLESTMQRAHWAEQQRDELKLRLESAEKSFERTLASKQTEIDKLQEEVSH